MYNVDQYNIDPKYLPTLHCFSIINLKEVLQKKEKILFEAN